MKGKKKKDSTCCMLLSGLQNAMDALHKENNLEKEYHQLKLNQS